MRVERIGAQSGLRFHLGGVCGMTCMMPIAPFSETMGILSDNMVRPPLSTRITALIQVTGTPKRRDALATIGCHLFTSWAGVMACSFSTTDCGARAGVAAVKAFRVAV